MLPRPTTLLLAIQLIAVTSITLLLARAHRQDQAGIPKPIDLQQPVIGSTPALPSLTPPFARPILLHFWNPDCPCSRFNAGHMAELARRYGEPIEQRVVIVPKNTPDAPAIWHHENVYLTIMPDREGKIARACGVYCTPQAVLLDREGRLLYRGNYNRNRYCLDRRTAFVQEAIECLLAGRPLPPMTPAMTEAYGCLLPVEREAHE